IEFAEIEAWNEESRRLLDRRESHVVTRNAIITDAVAAADDRLLIAEHIVGEAEGRPELDAAVLEAAAVDILVRNQYAVEWIAGTPHNPHDENTVQSVIHRRIETGCQHRRVNGASVVAFLVLDVIVDAGRPVKPHRLRRIVTGRIEEAALQSLIVLRLNPT